MLARRIFLFDEESLNSNSTQTNTASTLTNPRSPTDQTTTTINDYSFQTSTTQDDYHGIFEDCPGLNSSSERIVELQSDIHEKLQELMIDTDPTTVQATAEALHGESNEISFMEEIWNDLNNNGVRAQAYQEALELMGMRPGVPSPLEQFEIIQEKTTAERVEQEVIAGRSFKSMNLVQSILEEDEQSEQKNQDFVHLLPIHNNTFVTVTDARGNKKTGASAGCLEEIKGGSRLSKYAARATAEHVGRSARNLGMKSVVIKVKGSTYFRKKKAVILSWREGYTFAECKRSEEVGDQSPIMYIHDVTQLPHNGCRLPRKRRV